MIDNSAPIGVFDSGLGGLTVVNALNRLIPNEQIIYLGDTARVPYGDKSPETIVRFGIENSRFLVEQKVKLIVVACNTVSSIAMDAIRDEFKNIPIIGVLEAGVSAILASGKEDVAIIGTRSTINSGAYEREIRKHNSSIAIRSIACPLFAPIIEEGLAEHIIGNEAIDHYLYKLNDNPPEAMLLGCTHYPLIQTALEKYLYSSVEIIDSANAVANFAKNKLQSLNLNSNQKESSENIFYVTDSTEIFLQHAEKFLKTKIKNINRTILHN